MYMYVYTTMHLVEARFTAGIRHNATFSRCLKTVAAEDGDLGLTGHPLDLPLAASFVFLGIDPGVKWAPPGLTRGYGRGDGLDLAGAQLPGGASSCLRVTGKETRRHAHRCICIIVSTSQVFACLVRYLHGSQRTSESFCKFMPTATSTTP